LEYTPFAREVTLPIIVPPFISRRPRSKICGHAYYNISQLKRDYLLCVRMVREKITISREKLIIIILFRIMTLKSTKRRNPS